MRFFAVIVCSFWPFAVIAQQAADAIAPEAASQGAFRAISQDVVTALAAKAEGKPARAKDWMVVAANPHAVQAGADVLRAGGTAADALVAVQAVLGLVEPQSSGLGGGGFLVWYDGASGELTTLDGRETAPMTATPRLFQDAEGTPVGFWDAVLSGRSVGVPGMPALLETAHGKWGRNNWPDLLQPAKDLARSGFEVSPRLAGLIARDKDRLARHAATRGYFLPGGQPLTAGQVLKNPDYAQTLEQFAYDGAASFYALRGGSVADKIVRVVQEDGGGLSAWDMALYRVIERPAVCGVYRGYDVCGMGPPSSGALAVGQILGMLQPFDLAALGPDDPGAWRLIGDATRLAFADRGRYVADSDFVPVPVQGMLDEGYLTARAALLLGDDALPSVSAGQPEFDHALNWADATERARPSTTHVSIVDSYGNALSMTSSIENAFGSRLMAGGMLLNNQLTDFSFRSHRDGLPIANRVEPGKRPRSSMSPTIVLKDGKPVMVVGSPGGSRIIPYVAKTIIAHLDWRLDVQAAIALPHAVNRFGTYDLEAGTIAETLAPALQAMGYETSVRDLTSGLHAIVIGDGLEGGADPRREGIALGQ